MKHIKLLEDWATPYTKELSGITPADLDIDTFLAQARKYIKLDKVDALGHLVSLFLRKYGDASKAGDPEQGKMINAIGTINAEASEEGITIPGFSDGSFDSASTKAASKDYDSAVKARDFIKTKEEVEENIRSMTSKLAKYITQEITTKIEPHIGSDYGGELGRYYDSMYDRVIQTFNKSKYITKK